MVTGCCCGIEQIEKLERLGIYEIELSAGWIYQLDELEFQNLKKVLNNTKVKAHVCNCLMASANTSLFKDEQLKETKCYLNKLIPRLSEIGVKYIVFGSGNYRFVPENISEITKKEKICAFLILLSSTSKKYGITVVIEPLNQKETNVFLTSVETMEYINYLKIDNIKLLIDLYHFDLENEDFNNIIKFKDYIKHVHIARPVERCCPKLNDGYDYNKFLNALQIAEYNGIVSIESNIKDFEKDISDAKALIESNL